VTPREASSIAEAKRPAHGVPPAAEACPAEQRWIELDSRDKDGHRLVRDALVWVVRFVLPGAWIDLLIADSGGAVVRVDKSRGYVLTYDRPADDQQEVAP
jgi:hypothetical protein